MKTGWKKKMQKKMQKKNAKKKNHISINSSLSLFCQHPLVVYYIRMVVKTETCFFSEIRIYPGHGSRFARRDGRLLIFANHKSTAQYHNRKRAQTLRWTKSWRRANKKVAVDKQLTKKLVKKTTKVFKAFVGLSLDDLKQRQTDDFKRAQQQAAERAKKSGDKKDVKKSEVVAKSSIPKHVASRINKAQARK